MAGLALSVLPTDTAAPSLVGFTVIAPTTVLYNAALRICVVNSCYVHRQQLQLCL
jgi:hypothetical protein